MNTLLPAAPPFSKPLLWGKQVLVVDDDKALLHALTKVLRNEGAKVLPAGDVSGAIRYLSLNYGRIDLVLTDLRLPGASGKCILCAVKGSLVDVPVIVMTAFASEELREACAVRGAFAFLEKPANSATVLALVNRALSEAMPPPSADGG